MAPNEVRGLVFHDFKIFHIQLTKRLLTFIDIEVLQVADRRLEVGLAIFPEPFCMKHHRPRKNADKTNRPTCLKDRPLQSYQFGGDMPGLTPAAPTSFLSGGVGPLAACTKIASRMFGILFR